MDDEFFKNKRLVEMAKKANLERRQNNSKEQMKKAISAKLKTTMIGSLAKFEENFGYLWGHGKNDKTKNELEFAKLWDLVRTEVLNNGNNQLRAAMQEIDNYTITFDGFKTEFIMQRKEGN